MIMVMTDNTKEENSVILLIRKNRSNDDTRTPITLLIPPIATAAVAITNVIRAI